MLKPGKRTLFFTCIAALAGFVWPSSAAANPRPIVPQSWTISCTSEAAIFDTIGVENGQPAVVYTATLEVGNVIFGPVTFKGHETKRLEVSINGSYRLLIRSGDGSSYTSAWYENGINCSSLYGKTWRPSAKPALPSQAAMTSIAPQSLSTTPTRAANRPGLLAHTYSWWLARPYGLLALLAFAVVLAIAGLFLVDRYDRRRGR